MSNISVEVLKTLPVAEQQVEIVERKGVGHPDYICDAVMDEISVALSQEYIRRFGDILHHNIDKGMLVAGQVERRFGGGRVIKPMELIIGDRATFEVGGRKIPVEDIAIETARRWFRKNLRFVDGEREVRYRVVLAPASEELTDIFARKGKVRGANDTSAAVGYAPFTPTEGAVFEMERFLNSPDFKTRFPETGEDVKVMGLRRGKTLELTVAMPMLARYIMSEGEYFKRKGEILKALKDFSKARLAGKGLPFEDVNPVRRLGRGLLSNGVKLYYNTLDKKGHGLGGVYLSLLGTSAEDADSGQVGRGNRVNGVISLNRPMGTEAAAGKNPASHVGKIYTILAHELAREVYNKVEGIKEVYIWLLGQIGMPIDRPQLASAQIILKKGVEHSRAVRKVEAIVGDGISRVGELTRGLAEGRYPVC